VVILFKISKLVVLYQNALHFRQTGFILYSLVFNLQLNHLFALIFKFLAELLVLRRALLKFGNERKHFLLLDCLQLLLSLQLLPDLTQLFYLLFLFVQLCPQLVLLQPQLLLYLFLDSKQILLLLELVADHADAVLQVLCLLKILLFYLFPFVQLVDHVELLLDVSLPLLFALFVQLVDFMSICKWIPCVGYVFCFPLLIEWVIRLLWFFLKVSFFFYSYNGLLKYALNYV
jgi:hypothetical protein